MNTLLRDQTAQKQDVFLWGKAKLFRDLTGRLALSRVDPVWDKYRFPSICLTKILPDTLAQHNDAVGMADSRFFTQQDVPGSKSAPFFPHMVQPVNRNNDLLSH